MPKSPSKNKRVETLIDKVEAECPAGFTQLPKNIADGISLRPRLVIDFIQCLNGWDKSLEHVRTDILFGLIDEALCHVRYSIDRKDKKGLALFDQIQSTLEQVLPVVSPQLRSTLNQVLFDSKLMFEFQENNKPSEGNKGEMRAGIPDIMPKLPEFLDSLRRKTTFKTTFELYDLMLSQMHLMPPEDQLSLIAEMAYSKKPITHELAVLMLLHPKPKTRKKVAEVICHLSDERIFTPVDLRRLIMIRNWVPSDERKGIDNIVANLRKTRLSPAPYPVSKLTKLYGSSMDGAGVCFILAEAKKDKQRQVAGFLLKIDVGIREPWVMHKAPKHQLDEMISGNASEKLPARPVSKAYVNKVVSHFLAETVENGKVPEAKFMEIAELFGADSWQPRPLDWTDEVTRLREIYTDKLDSDNIKKSLQLSGGWHAREDITHAWFEAGDVAKQVAIDAENKSAGRLGSLSVVAADCFMGQCGDKWKTILLVTCLWMRTKSEHGLCADLFTVLHCIDNKVAPSDIPLICNIAEKTLASVFRRGMDGHD